MKLIKILTLTISIIFSAVALAQQKPPDVVAGIPVNYDESATGDYTLPELLMLKNGKKITNGKTWTEKRRPELIALFEENQYGKMPPKPAALKFVVFEKGTPAFDGKAIRRQVTVYFTKDTVHKMDLLIYLPANATKPVSLLLDLSFFANSGAVNDPGIKTSMAWSRDGKRIPVASRTPAPGRGLDIAKFVSQGFGIATVCYQDIEPDVLNAATWGIRGQYLKPGKTEPEPNEWGAVSAWAWGISRAMDYFETDKQVDSKRIAVHGFSRLGKTVLWAGAHDTRIKMIIAGAGGEGGAALSRRNYGETIAHLTAPGRFPYQFAANYSKWGKDPKTSPVDGHMLVSLMAPRPLLLMTGTTDNWSDPKGEFLSAIAAEPVYKLFGKNGPGITQMPAANDKSYLNTLGYYLHEGGHSILPGDWDVMVEYMKKYL